MHPDSKSRVNMPIYEQAADWLIEMREGEVDAETRERLDAWFRESPQHIRAYLELSSVWEDGADPDLDRGHGTDELIARARAAENVVSLSAGPVEGAENRTDLSVRSGDARPDQRVRPRRFFRRTALT